MSAELLPYYERELSFIRRLAAQFARQHPRIAGRLHVGPDPKETQDPHVERLIEAFAFLSARVHHKLDDEFPEISDSFLGALYPHYQAPLPSMAVVQMELDPEQKDLTTGHVVPRQAALETGSVEGEPVRFRTCYPVTLWQVRVEEAVLSRPPFKAPPALAVRAAAVLRLTLRCDAKGGFGALEGLDAFRFFLQGQPQHVYRLYELIFNDGVGLGVAPAGQPAEARLLDLSCLRPVGFERDEGLLAYTARSFLGYRLLTEFFAFPEKFLFIDLAGLAGRLPAGETLEISLYLRRAVPDLEQHVSAETFRLGCTPIVNLYRQRAEPIALTHTEHEYRVVPDARRPRAHEVYSVDRVTATAPDGRVEEYQPFFSIKHATAAGERYWQAMRRPSAASEGPPDHGTEVFLSLVDLALQPATAGGWTLDVETTCLSRDLPYHLPFPAALQLSEGSGLVTRLACLTHPTPTLRPALRRGALWRLVSHLTLGHLSLVDGGDQAEALREILKLYDFADSAQTRRVIEGLRGVSSRRVVGRVGPGTFCRGVEVTLVFDEDRFTGVGLFLFAAVLERFLGLYCTLNSFTKLVARTKGGEGELRRWPPRLGERVLT
jgi:type VI secretion system protein ImpG